MRAEEDATAAAKAAEEAAALQAAEAAAAALKAAELAAEEEKRNRPRMLQLAMDEERLASLVAHHGHRAAEVNTLHRQRDYLVSQMARSPLHSGASFASANGAAPVQMLVSPRYSPRLAAASPTRSGAGTPERERASPTVVSPTSRSGSVLALSPRPGPGGSPFPRSPYANVATSSTVAAASPRDSPVIQQYISNGEYPHTLNTVHPREISDRLRRTHVVFIAVDADSRLQDLLNRPHDTGLSPRGAVGSSGRWHRPESDVTTHATLPPHRDKNGSASGLSDRLLVFLRM